MASPATSTETRPGTRSPRWGRSTVTSSCSREASAAAWDVDGNEYLDATAGLWFVNGPHRAEIVDAVAEQLRTLAAHHVFGDQANPPALELAARLADLAPVEDAAVFGSSGGEAIDTAAKIARRYWALVGQPERTSPTSLRVPRHECVRDVASGIPAVRDGYGTLVGDVAEVAHDDPNDLARVLDELAGRVAAFVGEPVIGAGGVIPPPDGYWPAVADICRERDVLLIADEVISGFGRLGHWFGCERYGFVPDLMTCAKGSARGTSRCPRSSPAGACAPFWDEATAPFLHGGTYAGHPGACVAGLVNLDIIERERLAERAANARAHPGPPRRSARRASGVADVRSAGLAAAIEPTPIRSPRTRRQASRS